MTAVATSSGVAAQNAGQILFSLRGANMQSTADQAFTKLWSGSKYRITDIMAVQASGGASVACAGGIYDAAAKSGNAIVAVAQSWVTLASNANVAPALAALVGTTMLSNTPILSLTTGSTAACNANLFIFGYGLD
jgi:hypothetical protein